MSDNLSELPFPDGDFPNPKDKLTIFKGRTISPFINYVGDAGNWKHPLVGDIGSSVAKLVSVKAIDKDIQEDARQITFHGGDSNYYFQSPTSTDISHIFQQQGVLKFDIRIDKRPNHEVNILMGAGKMNFNHYLNVAETKKWKSVVISLDCFKKMGTDFSRLFVPMSLATFGSMKLSLANIEILSKAPTQNVIPIACQP